jgi:hypothetical protein
VIGHHWGVIIASTKSEAAAFLVIGILGLILGAAVYLVPSVFDAATRLRLRMQGLREDDEVTLAKDRVRRRFIALILCVGSAAMLASALSRL